MVIDGTGTPRKRADVGIRDGLIVAVGQVDEPATQTIDADGLVVAPGFIDLHTHYDAQIFYDPTLSPSPFHGVTTIVGGNCGLTLAPVSRGDQEFLGGLLASVESVPAATVKAAVDFNWETYGDFLTVVERLALGINVAFMVGHSALRRAVMGEASSERNASQAEITAMCTLLSEAIAAGGLGFSSANVVLHRDATGRQSPPGFAEASEFLALAEVCGRFPGTSIEFIPASVFEGFTPQDLELMAKMSHLADRRLNWNTLLLNRRDPELPWRQLNATDEALRLGGRVVPLFMLQNGPRRRGFGTDQAYRSMPGWEELIGISNGERVQLLSDPDTRKRLYAALVAQKTGVGALNVEWDDYYVNDVGGGWDSTLSGRRIGDIAAERSVSAFDAMLDVAVGAQLEVGFVRYDYPLDGSNDWAQDLRVELLKDPRVIWGVSDAGAHQDILCGADFPTRTLGELVRERQLFSLEEAVHKFTDIPAKLYGLRGRGRLGVGCHADVIVFDEATIGVGPLEILHDLPAGGSRLATHSTGMEHVLVGGDRLVVGGQLTEARNGHLLRSGRDTDTTTVSTPMPE
jgi:N-acyl-D-aspartate/D-glutamate deacylase